MTTDIFSLTIYSGIIYLCRVRGICITGQMIRVREVRYLEGESREVAVNPLGGGVSSTGVSSLRYSHEILDPVMMKDGPGESALRGGLSFLAFRNTNRIYPDTGESGEAYDAEASLEH